MNRRGLVQQIFNLMLAVVIIILAVAFSTGLVSNSNDIRNQTTDGSESLNCVLNNGSVNSSLNNFQEANCIATDLISPFFIVSLIGIAGAIMGAKILLS